jgi:L-seryl-tRNA(Ser) seleniumtransferase
LKRLATGLRGLDIPVIGRIEEQALVLDLRCLEDESAFVTNLVSLDVSESRNGPA